MTIRLKNGTSVPEQAKQIAIHKVESSLLATNSWSIISATADQNSEIQDSGSCSLLGPHKLQEQQLPQLNEDHIPCLASFSCNEQGCRDQIYNLCMHPDLEFPGIESTSAISDEPHRTHSNRLSGCVCRIRQWWSWHFGIRRNGHGRIKVTEQTICQE